MKVWQDLGTDSWLVSTIKEGYNLEFHCKPPLTSQPKFNLNSKHPQGQQGNSKDGGQSLTCSRKDGKTHDQSLSHPEQPIFSTTSVGEFTGTPEPTEAYVQWGKIHIHPIQQNLLSYSPQKDPHDLPILVWKDTREAIQWWMDTESFFKGYPIHQPT